MKRGHLVVGRFAGIFFLLFFLTNPATILSGRNAAKGTATISGNESSTAYRDGELLVKFRTRLTASEIASLAPELAMCVVKEFSFLSEQKNKTYALVRVDELSLRELLKIFSDIPEVEEVSPNFRRKLFAVPNDTEWEKLYGLRKISAPNAWDLTVGSPTVVVAVIDSGVDYTHEDLSANMWHNPGEIPGNGIDDDHNGYVDDYYGFDFSTSHPDPKDDYFHGTHVAGTIAAAGNNAMGVCGVSWNTKIMALRAGDDSGNIYESAALEALEYAVMMKSRFNVQIAAVNASYGGSGYNGLMEDAIALAENVNIVFVAAAGNGGADGIGDDLDTAPLYPASYKNANVIAVAATDANDQLADFSNFGPSSVDIAAPGVEVLSTVPIGKIGETRIQFNGNSIEAVSMSYGGALPPSGVNAFLIDCGMGLVAGDFPPAVSGNIALIQRGVNTFREKATLAQNAGALAVVIYNNESGSFQGTLCSESSGVDCTQFPWIPVVSISMEDGQSMLPNLPLSVNLVGIYPAYSRSSGTSMAAPHVSGVVALLAAYYPQESFRHRIGRIMAGGDAISGLSEKTITGTRLNAWQSLKLSVTVALYALRKTGNGWMVQRDAGWIRLEVDPEKMGQLSGGKFLVQRKEKTGAFAIIRTVNVSELENYGYEFYDKYLESDTLYTYRIQVFNAQGQYLGSSNIQTI